MFSSDRKIKETKDQSVQAETALERYKKNNPIYPNQQHHDEQAMKHSFFKMKKAPGSCEILHKTESVEASTQTPSAIEAYMYLNPIG